MSHLKDNLIKKNEESKPFVKLNKEKISIQKTGLPALLLASVVSCSTLFPDANAASPVPKISWQGRLIQNGIAVDGSRMMTFTLYDEQNTALWQEVQQVDITNGVYSVLLGAVKQLNLPFDKPYYLGVSIDGSAILSPLQPLVSSPYAMMAGSIADGAITTTQKIGIECENNQTLKKSPNGWVCADFPPAMLTGTADPTNDIGQDGDFYYQSARQMLVGPKSNGVWPAGVSLQGPRGAKGATGAVGPTGDKGATGLAGAAGPVGAVGPTGPKGAAGAVGSVGPTGPKGGTGATGATGSTGATGATGATGPKGAKGPKGPKGATGPTGPAGP